MLTWNIRYDHSWFDILSLEKICHMIDKYVASMAEEHWEHYITWQKKNLSYYNHLIQNQTFNFKLKRVLVYLGFFLTKSLSFDRCMYNLYCSRLTDMFQIMQFICCVSHQLFFFQTNTKSSQFIIFIFLHFYACWTLSSLVRLAFSCLFFVCLFV